MLLVECDGKSIFKEFGISVPDGIVAASPTFQAEGTGPWVVKAQVPVGGRGKAGGIKFCDSAADVENAIGHILQRSIGSRPVTLCLVEKAVRGTEAYFSVMVDATSGGLQIMYSEIGGIEIEHIATQSGEFLSEVSAATPQAAEAAISRLVEKVEAPRRNALFALGTKLTAMLFERELMLAEINPLFWSDDGPVAGDAKVAIDLNSLERQPKLRNIITDRPDIYVDANLKLKEGFDFIEIDEHGAIGLLTTGAGLSMMLIDELIAKGASPANFCDVRTGQLRGSSDRIVRIFEWLAAKPHLKVVLINIFAGITDLGEFAALLVEGLERSPQLKVPIVVRIVGNNETEAKRLLQERRPEISVYADLDEAISRAIELTKK